jgi:uncharacterized protein YecE (DUF72 family)
MAEDGRVVRNDRSGRSAVARVGISGWRYPPWRGVFYPKGLRQRDELRYVADHLTSVEINGSFYALQRPANYRTWYAETPTEFVFSVKGPRFISHMKKLRDVELPLANFYASGLLALREKLGPILWQLPPNLGFDASRLTEFFTMLPRTTFAAARLARRHEERLADRALTRADADRPLRYALEVRHGSYRTPEFVELLREHDIALVVADTAGRWPLFYDVTSEIVYVRLHGDQELYVSGYSDEALATWAERIRGWTAAGRDVFAYFDNDVKVRAPYDAIQLLQRLGGSQPG